MARYVWMFSFLMACGGNLSPVEKCEQLIDVVCDRLVDCVPSAGSRSECVQELRAALPCGSVTMVSATYDRCIDLLETSSCPVLFPDDPQTGDPALRLPADCDSVILTEREAPSGEVLHGPLSSAAQAEARDH